MRIRAPVGIDVELFAAAAGEMQREIALRTLTDLLVVWQREVKSRHNKNKLTITSNDQLVC